MKLGILSRAPKAYSTQRLKAAALERGHEARVLNTLRFAIDLSGGAPDLQYRGKPLSNYDAVLPRIGASVTFFGMAVVRQFEQMDVYTPITANGIANSRDKLRSIQILSRHDIGIPATTFARDQADVLPAIERVGGAPVVIKLLEGTHIGCTVSGTTVAPASSTGTDSSGSPSPLRERVGIESTRSVGGTGGHGPTREGLPYVDTKRLIAT